jgi:hypothetical protein
MSRLDQTHNSEDFQSDSKKVNASDSEAGDDVRAVDTSQQDDRTKNPPIKVNFSFRAVSFHLESYCRPTEPGDLDKIAAMLTSSLQELIIKSHTSQTGNK